MDTSHTNKFYPLPCMLTCSSLFSGFYSIVASINGNFFAAAIAILVAAIFDGLDGRVARMTGSTSRFGMELDSLCDLVSFGVAPALLAYLWALLPYGRYGWLAAFLYVATTALRLARFNSAVEDNSASHDFVGLPCPAAAGMIATTVMFAHFLGATETVKHLSLLLLVYVLSYLMVSTHRYLSFKQPTYRKGKSFQMVVGMILFIILLATEPPVTLFAVAFLYVLSGPAMAMYQFATRAKSRDLEDSEPL
ncbi:CDP-diacylglycerol--serine O-phosphatidyltransferase [Desulfolithobacter dissulfuricans]|uniref:CDP-diacylglycerol--serine O-phosphatidyltransferase n=1 Tax=Desulfolithobacter dissulfuricans TaxID=2795293 RepID=A0A915XIX0_9BACT|nr:CDP-diacylglycerol--serine O-phosphatidyltransferase [Desulfolithobacter dissulfuricans]BCO09640.1 CDP-diacylglycerol--serine O-phosphatidyltransferase [Desulfolithobacter dissulfuricans]